MTKTAYDMDRLTAFKADPEDLVIIGLDTKDGPEHPLYDERIHLPLNEALVVDIMANGVIEPVRVKKNRATGKPEVAVGRQRVRAAREANKRLHKANKSPILVPIFGIEGDDATLLGVGVSENEHRQNDPITLKAVKAARLINAGKSQEDCARHFGIDVQTLRGWLALNDLDPKVRKAVDAGSITATAASALAKLDRAQQREAVEKHEASGARRMTVTQAKSTVKARTNGSNNAEPATVAPSKRLVTKILKLNKKLPAHDQLPEQFVRGILYMCGDLNPRNVQGLVALERKARGEE